VTRAVQWSRTALDDLEAQVAYIARANPDAARRVAARLGAAAEALGAMATGRPGRVTGTYEKSVARLPYILAYSISGEGGREVVSILRVIHTARDWPAEDWPD
jgi:plasmid stabilization system protein ParE